MNYIIINLSLRKKGTSNMLSEYFADRLKSEVNSIETCDLYSNLDKMDNLLNAFLKITIDNLVYAV